MTDQQLSLLTSLIQQYPQLAVILAWYHPDKRMVRYIMYYAFPSGVGYIQYPIEY